MTTEPTDIFPLRHASPGEERLSRLLDALGGETEVDRGVLHELSRALESGFRRPVTKVLERMPRPEPWRAAIDSMPRRWWFIREDFELVATGFGPFQEHKHNPSKPFARALSAALSDHFSASYEGLSVTHREIDEFVDLYDYESQPLLIHCGLAAERSNIALERYAHNCRSESADGDGQASVGDWVVPGGPAALETLLPLDDWSAACDQALASTDVNTGVSRDAGNYVCNMLYYRSLLEVRRARRDGRAAEALFIHIPNLDEDTARVAGRAVGRAIGSRLDALMGDQFV
jgi:pyroglutamyl-peptidase